MYGFNLGEMWHQRHKIFMCMVSYFFLNATADVIASQKH